MAATYRFSIDSTNLLSYETVRGTTQSISFIGTNVYYDDLNNVVIYHNGEQVFNHDYRLISNRSFKTPKEAAEFIQNLINQGIAGMNSGTLVGALTAPYMPYWDGFVMRNSWFQYNTTSTLHDYSKTIVASNGGNRITTFNFNQSSGSNRAFKLSFNDGTDDSFLSLIAGGRVFLGSNSYGQTYLSATPTSTVLNNDSLITLAAPSVTVSQDATSGLEIYTYQQAQTALGAYLPLAGNSSGTPITGDVFINTGVKLVDANFGNNFIKVRNSGAYVELWGNGNGTLIKDALILGESNAYNGNINLLNSTNSNQITIQSGVTSSSYDLTLPTAQAGGANYALVNNGAGVLSWSAMTGGTVTSVSVTTNQGVSGVVATATTTPAITLSLGALTGVTSINGLVITANTGVVTTGTWNASIVTGTYGGTGVNNGASTITIAGNLVTTGAFNTTLAAQFTGTTTLPPVATTLTGKTGTMVAGYVSYWNDANQITGNSLFTYASNNLLIGGTTADPWGLGTSNFLNIQSQSGNAARFQIIADSTSTAGFQAGNATIRRGGLSFIDGSHMVFFTNPTNSGTGLTEAWRISSSASLSNTAGTGTAYFHLKAGTATASTGPLKFTAGTPLTTPESGVLETDSSNNLWYTNSTTVRGKVNVVRSIVSSAGTLTLAATYTNYVFSGTTTTWTLPALTGNTNVFFYIKNRGSGIITLNSSAGGNDIYSSSAVATISINPGEAYFIVNDGTYYNIE